MRKIIGNWRKTMTVVLLPALLLLAAINIFPILMNYLSTGHLQSIPITVIGAPDSFRDYIDTNEKASFYSITWLTSEEGEELTSDEEEMSRQFKKGRVFIRFVAFRENGREDRSYLDDGWVDVDEDAWKKKKWAKEADLILEEGRDFVGYLEDDFDTCVEDFYENLASGKKGNIRTYMQVLYDGSASSSYLQARQFLADLGDGYSDYLLEELGQPYIEAGGGNRWETDAFNPFNFVLKNRANANYGASRTIPSMMILLMYYCIYSLSAETLASTRQSGFLTKVYLTPISKHALLTGKALMVITVGAVSAVVTYFMLFMSSWINRSNSAYSMLPFGLFLTGSQLLICLITLFISAVLMTFLCFAIIFRLRRMEDVIMNLQVPLVLLIFEFFGNMFRPGAASGVEYVVPIHNSIMLIRDVFLGTFTWSGFTRVTVMNVLFVICIDQKNILREHGMR